MGCATYEHAQLLGRRIIYIVCTSFQSSLVSYFLVLHYSFEASDIRVPARDNGLRKVRLSG